MKATMSVLDKYNEGNAIGSFGKFTNRLDQHKTNCNEIRAQYTIMHWIH